VNGVQVFLAFVVAFLLWISYMVGRARGMWIERNRTPEPVQPICPCEHVWGAHKDGGRCQAAVRRPYYNNFGTRSGYEWVGCACTKYHGPEMLTKEYFNPGTFTT